MHGKVDALESTETIMPFRLLNEDVDSLNGCRRTTKRKKSPFSEDLY